LKLFLQRVTAELFPILSLFLYSSSNFFFYPSPAKDAMDFFVSVGFRRPLNANPADHFLDLVQCQEEHDDESEMLNDKQGQGQGNMIVAPKTNDKVARYVHWIVIFY
jgi:ribosomal protein L16 Arg81 hydroxylase